MTIVKQKKIQAKITDGKETLFKLVLGIPKIYHGIKLSGNLENDLKFFLTRDVKLYDSLLLVVANTIEDSCKVGARITEIAYEEKICRVNMIGFKAFLSVYKTSFRDSEMKMLLKDKIDYSDVLLFYNINDISMNLWSDPRDTAMFRGLIHNRMINKKKTVFCTTYDFIKDESGVNKLEIILGASNKHLLDNVTEIKIYSREKKCRE